MDYENLLTVYYDDDESEYGYSIKYNKLSSLPVDDVYAVLGEVLCILGDLYDIIGDKRNETRRTTTESN